VSRCEVLGQLVILKKSFDARMKVRSRFSPSPTGTIYVGSVRTALFCWLYMRQCDGDFILRIEDTDRERSTAENVDAIFDGLNWLEIVADETPQFQSNRFDRYTEVIERWLSAG
jgi:glutamyl-tRNA synthetase